MTYEPPPPYDTWAWVAFGAGLLAIAFYILVVVMAGDVEDV